MSGHGAKKTDAAIDVDIVVVERFFRALANSLTSNHVSSKSRMDSTSEAAAEFSYLESCEVDDRVNIRMLVKDCVKSFLVCNVQLLKIRSLPADELNAIDDLCR